MDANGSVTTEASSSEAASEALEANQEGGLAETKLFAWSCLQAWTMLIF
jgi:hypothetical protein